MSDQFEQLKTDREYIDGKTDLIPAKDSRGKKIRKTILTVGFVALNIAVILVTGIIEFTKDPQAAANIPFRDVNLLYLLIAGACLLAVLALETFKYYLMSLKTLGRANLRHSFEVAALGKYYDSITPSGAGGQPFQMYYLRKAGYSRGTAGSLPVLGFLTMQIGFVVVAAGIFIADLCGGFGTNTLGGYSTTLRIPAYIGLVCYMLVPTAIILFTIAPKQITRLLRWFLRLGAKLRIVKDPAQKEETMLDSLNAYRESLRSMVKIRWLVPQTLLIGILYQVALCAIPFFVLRAFGGAGSFIDVFTLTVYIYAGITIIPTPGNAGAAEASFYAIFSVLTKNFLFWAMLVWRFLTYYSFLLIGVGIYGFRAWENRGRKPAAEKAEDLPDEK